MPQTPQQKGSNTTTESSLPKLTNPLINNAIHKNSQLYTQDLIKKRRFTKQDTNFFN